MQDLRIQISLVALPAFVEWLLACSRKTTHNSPTVGPGSGCSLQPCVHSERAHFSQVLAEIVFAILIDRWMAPIHRPPPIHRPCLNSTPLASAASSKVRVVSRCFQNPLL
jgi:hypothetical protein